MPTEDKNTDFEAAKKLDEAIQILTALRLGPSHRNKTAGYTFLALLNLSPTDEWQEAKDPLMGITPIIDFIAKRYGVRYAPNTRETIRKAAVNAFVEAGLLVRNPDDPNRPQNSGRTVYQVRDVILNLVHSFGKASWNDSLTKYLLSRELLEPVTPLLSLTDVDARPTDDEGLVVDDETEDEEAQIHYDIASYPSDLTLNVIYEMWRDGDIKIPEFQRNFVWNIKQASLLIESFLIGLPVPQVFFYVDNSNKSLVIDGQQRILSIIYFFDGYFGSENIHGAKQVFRLQGLGDSNPFSKKRFVDLSESHQRKLKGAVLRAINIRQLNPQGEATSIYHIFERLNTGGTPLTSQEIRNCVFRGGLISLFRQLNENAHWRQILGKSTFDKHQKDVELILRIFSLTYFFDDYEKPMKEFLNRIMSQERRGDSANAKQFKDKFSSISSLILQEFGDRPFHLRGPLNASALDTVYAVLLQAKGKFPENLRDRFARLNNSKEFKETTFYSTSDLSVISRRFDICRQILLC